MCHTAVQCLRKQVGFIRGPELSLILWIFSPHSFHVVVKMTSKSNHTTEIQIMQWCISYCDVILHFYMLCLWRPKAFNFKYNDST